MVDTLIFMLINAEKAALHKRIVQNVKYIFRATSEMVENFFLIQNKKSFTVFFLKWDTSAAYMLILI